MTDHAVIGLTPEGIIGSWNPGAERLKGYTREEVVGRHFSMFYPVEAQQSDFPQRFLDEARTEGSARHSGWRIRKNGTRFWGDVILTALYVDSDALVGYVKVTQDLTDRVALDAGQDTFYNVFIHDFRIPLAAVKGFARLIGGAGPLEQSHFLDRVEANADLMLEMAQELVDHARGSARLTNKPEAVDLAMLTREVIMNLRTDAVRITVTPGPVLVMADPATLHRVIANVLTNALKYSDAGTPIAFSVEEVGEHGVLRVTDQGRGIDKRDLASIFVEFERGRLAEADGGTGLGLSSARRLIHQLGGTITIDSEIGVGTTVTIKLPRPRTT